MVYLLNYLPSIFPKSTRINFLYHLCLLETGRKTDFFKPIRKPRKGAEASRLLKDIMGSMVIWWAETREKDGKPIGVNAAAEHACEVLDVQDRATPFRWMQAIPNTQKEAIRQMAGRWRAGERRHDVLTQRDDLGIGGHVGPLFGEQEEHALALYEYLHQETRKPTGIINSEQLFLLLEASLDPARNPKSRSSVGS